MSVDALGTKTFSRLVVPKGVIYSEALDDLLEKFRTVMVSSGGRSIGRAKVRQQSMEIKQL